MLTILAACSKNNVIGINNELPWHLPEDLKRFKSITTGKNVLMGRKTYQSIGRPLPNRTNIVLTRDENFKPDGVLTYNNINDIKSKFDDIIVIGGEEIYKQLLNDSDVIELTLIEKEFDGDAFFPEIGEEWIEEKRESFENEKFKYHYITYKKS